jgi:hypothetical protein
MTARTEPYDVINHLGHCPECGATAERTWVDLTEEEIYAAIRRTRFPSTDITVSQSVIEAFKGKNK